MSFWPLNIFNGYSRADRMSKDSSESSTMFYFGAKNPTKKKKKKKQSPACDSMHHVPSSSKRSNNSNMPITDTFVLKKQDRFEYYRVALSKNETLHTIAMKYGCSVWELKRANRLWGLQDVHALTSLLVPAPQNSYRAELLAKSGGRLVPRRRRRRGLHSEEDDDDDDDHPDAYAGDSLLLADDSDPPDNAGDLAVPGGSAAAAGPGASTAVEDHRRAFSIRQGMTRSHDSLPGDCDRFLRTLDADLEQIKQSTCFLKDSLPEAADYLNTPAVLPMRQVGCGGGPPSWLRRLKGSGADGGLSWRGAICVVCVLCLLVPALVYFLIVHQRSPH